MIIDIRRHGGLTMLALGLVGLLVGWAGSSTAPAGTASAGEARAVTPTLRDAADALAARHRLRIVIDPAVRSDGPAAFDPAASSLPVEAQLQRLFAAHELLLQHTADRGSGTRLVAAWVFARAEDLAVVPRATLATTVSPLAAAARPAVDTLASPTPPTAAARSETGRGLLDSDESVRLQALQSAAAEAAPASLHDLRRLVLQDPSEAVRLQALEALAAHPEAGEAELAQLLDQLAAHPYTLLGEQARALREARQPGLAALAPEPVDPAP